MRVLAAAGRYKSLIGSITKPVLLIHGQQDRLVAISAAREVAADNPAWKTELLPGVGHTPQLEVPDAVVAQITTWLKEHELDRAIGRPRP
jgi:pimeloyl-ACP methyl ester carboxylesterase